MAHRKGVNDGGETIICSFEYSTSQQPLSRTRREMNSATARGIEGSDIFLALVTESYVAEGHHKDEIAYAKALEKPFALAIEKYTRVLRR